VNPPVRRAIPLVRARGIIKDLNIREPDEIDVEAIAVHYGALVQEAELRGADGSIVIRNGRAVISVRSTIDFEAQKRFVIAHELGHFFLHPDARQVDEVDAHQSHNWSNAQAIEEYEANLFAAELLMPDALFAARVDRQEPSFDHIEKLSREFKTTLTSTAVQFVNYTHEECVLVSSANRRRKWFIPSKGFSFRMEEDGYIHGYSCAKEVGLNKKRVRAKDVPAQAWLEEFRHDPKPVVTEDAWYFSTLDRTLSLIWVEDAI